MPVAPHTSNVFGVSPHVTHHMIVAAQGFALSRAVDQNRKAQADLEFLASTNPERAKVNQSLPLTLDRKSVESHVDTGLRREPRSPQEGASVHPRTPLI